MSLLAAFPMYALPEVKQAMAEFWRQVQRGLPEFSGEPIFENPMDGAVFEPVGLVQLCSYPYLKQWQKKQMLSPLASFHYDFPHCVEETHCGVMLVQKDTPFQNLSELRGSVVAVNESSSNSGMNLFRRELAVLANGHAFFSQKLITGGHIASMEALISGEADIAAVDAVTLGYVTQYRPDLASSLRVIGNTRHCPSLPLFVPYALNPESREKIMVAIRAVLADPAHHALTRGRLHITGISPVDDAALEIVRQYEHESEVLGYPDLV